MYVIYVLSFPTEIQADLQQKQSNLKEQLQ